MFAGTGQIAFQATGVADATFRVIYKTKQVRTTSTGAVAFDVRAHLLREFLGAEAGTRFLYNDGESILIEEKGRTRCAVAVGRRPFVCVDVIKLEAEQGMEQILHIALVLDIQGRPMLAAQAQLASDEVESLAERLCDVQVVHFWGH